MEGAGSEPCERPSVLRSGIDRGASRRWLLDQASKLWLLFVFDIAPPRRGQGHAVLRSGAGLEYRHQLRLVPERQPGRPRSLMAIKAVAVVAAGDLDGALADRAGDNRASA